MPELSEEQVRWMRNRFVEIVQRMEKLSSEITLMRQELNSVVDALGRLLPDQPDPAEPLKPDK